MDGSNLKPGQSQRNLTTIKNPITAAYAVMTHLWLEKLENYTYKVEVGNGGICFGRACCLCSGPAHHELIF